MFSSRQNAKENNKKNNKESLTTKLTLVIIGLTAGSALLVPATYASFHPVTTGEIADDTIRSADISNSAGVYSVDIVNGQVGSADIGTGQVRTGDIGDGQVGSVDIANDAIKPNIQRITAQETIELNTQETIFVDCPAGTIVTGGGYFTSGAVQVTENFPLEDLNTWRVGGQNNGNVDVHLTAYVVCIGPMP